MRMRLWCCLAVAGLIAGAPLSLLAPTHAQPKPAAPPPPPAHRASPANLQPGSVVVVDVQEIMRTSQAARSIQQQLEAQRAAYQEEVNKKESDLRKVEQELTQQRLVLADDAFNQRKRDFENRVNDVQRDVQARKRQLDQAFEENMTKVRTALLDVIEAMATESKIAVVLPRSNVVLADRGLDMTQEVQARLDKKLPSIKVTLPPLKP